MNDILDFGNVFAPLLATVVCWMYLLRRLRGPTETYPICDVGLIFATFVSLYAVMPLVAVLIVGDNINDLTDNRLRGYFPSPEEVGSFSWNSVAFLGGFVLVYSKVWRQRLQILFSFEDGQKLVSGALAIVVILSIYFIVLAIIGGVVTTTTYDDSYIDNYERYANLPLVLQQITGRLNGVLFVSKIALVAIVVRNIRDPWWQFIGVIWLIYELAKPFIELGSRSGSMFLFLVLICCYNSMVRPIAIPKLVSLVLAFFLAYMVQGVLRSGADISGVGTIASTLSMNEFQSVFATAFDIKIRFESGHQDVPWQLYVADFMRLVPQQLSPLEKVDPAEWYLELIGYKGTGVGFSFGVISEGLLGFGLIDIFVRGAVLGGVVGLIHNAACKNSRSFGWIIFYLWFCTRIYLSYRNSIFFWLSSFFYEFLPAIAMLHLLKSGTRRNRSAPV
jgi:hypothetical protein